MSKPRSTMVRSFQDQPTQSGPVTVVYPFLIAWIVGDTSYYFPRIAMIAGFYSDITRYILSARPVGLAIMSPSKHIVSESLIILDVVKCSLLLATNFTTLHSSPHPRKLSGSNTIVGMIYKSRFSMLESPCSRWGHRLYPVCTRLHLAPSIKGSPGTAPALGLFAGKQNLSAYITSPR